MCLSYIPVSESSSHDPVAHCHLYSKILLTLHDACYRSYGLLIGGNFPGGPQQRPDRNHMNDKTPFPSLKTGSLWSQ